MHTTRRNFLARSSGLGVGALTSLLMAGAGQAAATRRIRRCVLLFMHGGASQLDTFDPKPGRETGGPFRAIESSLSGLRISEHLPRVAAQMHDLALVRSLVSKEGNHDRARYLMHTGFVRQGGVTHPGLGSHVARLHPREEPLPGYVAIGGPGQASGYLGPAQGPFVVPDPRRPVRNLSPARPIADARVRGRVELWRAFEDEFAAEHPTALVAGQRAVGERAIEMVRSPRLDAFDLEKEPAATRARFGEGRFGTGCLMARRLLERGVSFVEVAQRGWDTHEDNFTRVETLSADLDRGFSSLVDDLRASGLLESTLVIWLGDFGRTPRINRRGGRDHFPAIASVVLGGAGIRKGVVVGATDDDGESIVERPVSVAELFASIAATVGLDPGEVHMTPGGRPVTTVEEGARPISELLAD
jgi:hypothetical protein